MNNELLKYFNGDELAANVWLGKYAQQGDITPDDMHKRMAKEFARIEWKYREEELKSNFTELSDYGNKLHKKLQKAAPKDINDHIYELFKDFKWIIPQGSVMANLGNPAVTSLSNCFVIGQPSDSYGGIMRKDEQMVQLMKRRGGVGLDISTLRPKGTEVTNAAKSSTGMPSFMDRYSNSTREVAQDGRRGALMLSTHINHPDVLEFIQIKRNLTKVTGANISVKITDEFMEAVEKDEDFALRFPCDTHYYNGKENFQGSLGDLSNFEYNKLYEVDQNVFIKRVRAKEYWEEIIKSAHMSAEPGIIFVDNHHDYSPDGVYPQFKGITTNPSLRHDTLIQTDLGLFSIKELAEKQGLTIVKNVLNEWQVGKVFMSGKDKDLFKITFTNGYEVFCTAEHKWVILNSTKNIFNQNSGKVLKKRTDELMFGQPKLGGDRIPVPFKPNYEGNVSCNLTENDGFLAGYYLGDGHKSQCSDERWQYGFIVSDKEMNCCGKKLIEIINSNKTKDTISNWNKDHESKASSVYVSQKGFVDYCESLTLVQDKSLGIPKNVWTAGSTYIKGFIDGLFSSDGSVWDNKDLVHSRITLTTSRIKIAQDIQKLLNLFGIISNIFYHKNKEGFERWDLTISGIQARKFALTFKLTSSYKQIKLNNILNFENTYKDNREYLVIKSVENTGIKEDVYDITVYDDTHTFMGEFGVTGNCGEIFMQEYDACRLIVINYFSFVKNPFTPEAKFDFEKFYKINYEAMRLSDDLIDLEIEHINRILRKIAEDPESFEDRRTEYELWIKIKETATASRRTGLGFTALGDALAALGLKYDSDESIKIIEQISKTKMESELDCTIDLAILRGTFTGWDFMKEFNVTFSGKNDFYQMLCNKFPEQAHRMGKYGRRNVSFSTVAPTGTVSLMSQTTSGIEPLFSPYYFRRKKINPNDEGVRVDFTDQNGDNWQEFPVLHPKFKDWYIIKAQCEHCTHVALEALERASKEQLKEIFEMSPYYQSTANDIDWVKRVEIQSVIQKYITHSISSTINLPNNVTEAEVSEIYIESWKKGLKGITVYRDGSRSGVLITESTKDVKTTFEYRDAPKRPKELPCDIHHLKIKDEKFTVLIGMLDSKPYEVFVIPYEIGKNYKTGFLNKQKSGKYNLIVSIDEELPLILDVAGKMTDTEEILTRFISTSLRHGSNIQFIVEQLNKSKGDMFSFSKSIARVLKKYIPDGAKSTVKCNECGSSNVIFQEGCMSCKDCGSSKCG